MFERGPLSMAVSGERARWKSLCLPLVGRVVPSLAAL
jgi:hypothetical protein